MEEAMWRKQQKQSPSGLQVKRGKKSHTEEAVKGATSRKRQKPTQRSFDRSTIAITAEAHE